MKKNLLYFFMMLVMLCGFNGHLSAQVTTSAMSGRITDNNHEALIGASVKAKHMPSGTVYGAITNVNGNYSLLGMRPGGPYELTISYIGYETKELKNIMLNLGETSEFDFVLGESSTMLEAVVVTAQQGSRFNAQKTGAASNFNAKVIQSTPSISRSIFDVARLTPQAVSAGSGTSFAGSNNRYNSFQIDGTVNNDVFGLSGSGTNGGQTGANPISLDAIQEVQVVIAPFDVRQSGFTGGGVNAITKSGTNKFSGSVYGYYNDENFAGTTPGKDIENRKKLSDQYSKTYGVTFGGPIVKNKLFFFGNFESVKESYPTSFNVGEGSLITKEEADAVEAKIKSLFNGYNGGGYGMINIPTESKKVLARIDWNVSDAHNMTLRYSYLDANKLNFGKYRNALRFNDNGYTMVNKTHSIVGELNSRFSDKVQNELRLSYTRVRDHRDFSGPRVPYTKIELTKTGDDTRSIEFGTERYSTANALDQDIYSLTDNLTFIAGNHTIVLGTHNEFFHMKNLFIRENFGSYVYRSLDDFLSIGTQDEAMPKDYNYSFSREDVTGSKRWAPAFSAAQFGLYLQDEWRANDLLRLTYGLRVDMPVFFDKPTANPDFNKSAIAKEYDVATDVLPKSKPLFSPRIGFRYKLDEDSKSLLRGGLGIFTGRIPFVWISNSFSNSGVEYSRTRINRNFPNDFRYSPDPDKQYVPKGVIPTEIDVVDKNFKYPQVLRGNLAFDAVLPGGIKATIESLYSKTMNNVAYKDLARRATGQYLDIPGIADHRPLYDLRPDAKQYNAGLIYLTNTSKGYTFNFTSKLEKDFDFGLNAMVAYTYGQSKGINDGTSSQASSNWKYNEVYGGDISPELSFSDFDITHRIVASLTYRVEYLKHFATTISLLYNGQSGDRYSLVYNGDINGDGQYGNDLIWIPTKAELAKMQFNKFFDKRKGKEVTAEEQRRNLENFIEGDKYLSKNRGSFAERNALQAKFHHHFDLHIAQDFFINVGGQRHTFQINADILNIGNLFNRGWGLYDATSYNYNNLAYKGKGKFEFANPDNGLYGIADYSSRWRAQIGLKYMF
ncbi:TonB-dependent receptor [Porphyromonas macacae]|uniref:TonB-dependent transporter Oar-like beta-barrel domain-containing protein n=1 Tax=Porphyromonas macacae TaxID=28115 RepID=A0A379DFC2_9PORP|nr:TonB-dependent receptor [Porphyromonas macacae]SUB77108.1 Uncharacterised protein [Porphyromonas macacae]